MGKKNLKEFVNNKKSTGHWKGGKKKQFTYENTKYTGGRVEGRKNLKKLDDGTLENQHRVRITPEEKKMLETAVNRVNAKRKRMLAEEAKLPRLKGGKPTGQTVGQLQLMGKESDFIISRRSKSLQQFKSREAFEKYMKELDYISSDSYLDDRTRLYKANHIKALENTFGDEAKDVMMKIRMMKPKDYRELLQKEEDLEVSFVYDPKDATAKLNQIRLALGMKTKEEPI